LIGNMAYHYWADPLHKHPNLSGINVSNQLDIHICFRDTTAKKPSSSDNT
jgi:hypothetical protein